MFGWEDRFVPTFSANFRRRDGEEIFRELRESALTCLWAGKKFLTSMTFASLNYSDMIVRNKKKH